MNASIRNAALAFMLFASPLLRADPAACEAIRAANVKTGSDGVHMRSTGYAFATKTPAIYAEGEHSCSHLRDEPMNGQSAAMYRERYASAAGSTDATIWISKTTGRVLREEQAATSPARARGISRTSGRPDIESVSNVSSCLEATGARAETAYLRARVATTSEDAQPKQSKGGRS